MRRLHVALTCAVLGTLFASGTTAKAGSVFLTGHDPDFHASLGGNGVGAQHINQTAIGFITDTKFNTFAAAGVKKFLFVESKIAVPSGHTDGENGIVASGYTLGTDFETHTASDLTAEIDKLGTKYDAIVIGSDFGGLLTQAELNILNNKSSTIINFLNAGGGLYAMAESNSGAGLTPDGGQFKFLPFVVASAQKDQSESGITLTSFGTSLGLTTNDVNGNASHNIFDSAPLGLSVVDKDASGQILSIAGRPEKITAVPLPAAVWAALPTLVLIVAVRKLKAGSDPA